MAVMPSAIAEAAERSRTVESRDPRGIRHGGQRGRRNPQGCQVALALADRIFGDPQRHPIYRNTVKHIIAWALLAFLGLIASAEPFPGPRNNFHGCALYAIKIGEDPAQVLVPDKPAPGRPWVLAAQLYPTNSAPVTYMARTEIELVHRGFHVVALPLGNTFGAPKAIAKYDGVYREMTGRYQLAGRMALLGLSREGLAIARWAAANPGKVTCLYLDKAVCDFKSWPGGKLGTGQGSAADWVSLQQLYGFQSEAEAMAYPWNPIDLAPKLVAHGVAILYLAGENDPAVPFSENGGRMQQEYKRLGGEFERILHPGEGHHPHGSPDPTPVVDFIQRQATKPVVPPRPPHAVGKPVPGHLLTPWATDVNPRRPLPEYPRPQMVRPAWINLNGLWDYAIQPKDLPRPEKFTGKILVPYPVESALSGVKLPVWKDERLWYRRTFNAPKRTTGKRLLLHFGAVDWEANVFVNRKPVGEHRGGYDAFSLDITDAVTPHAENELVVAVFDATGSGQAVGKQNYNKYHKPGSIAYTATTGIWQTVWMETVDDAHLQALRLIPDVDAGCLRVAVDTSIRSPDVPVEVVAFAGRTEVGRARGSSSGELRVPIAHPRLWSPQDPFLYRLQVRWGGDEVRSYFGMRSIALGKDEHGFTTLLLNGRPVFQSGVLDQGYWPDGNYTAPTEEALRWDLAEMKRLGFNMVRKHMKIEPARWYHACDQLGLLVWQDMPGGGAGHGGDREVEGKRGDEAVVQQFESELRSMITQHWNHPSIILWTVFNEAWGQYDTARLTQQVKQLDPSRIVESTSGWADIGSGDVQDRHTYPGPDCPDPEPARAAVLGEFGGLGLSVPGHTWVESAWSYHGAGSVYSLNRQYVDLWHQVWQLRAIKGLCAAVYTQWTDVESEGNGLYTYDRRRLKVDASRVADAHRGIFAPAVTLETLVPTARQETLSWHYTTEQPSTHWSQPSFDDTAWQVGAGGFGAATVTHAPIHTLWSTGNLWLRREFLLPKGKLNHPTLQALHGQDSDVFLNGILAAKLRGRRTTYDEFEIRPEAAATLKPGRNWIAIHCLTGKSEPFIDIGLVQEGQQENKK